MSSSYTVAPASLHDLRNHSKDRVPQPHPADSFNNSRNGPTTSLDSHLLSPYSSQPRSNSASPFGNPNTPAETTSTSDIYETSEFSSDFPDDPFFGADFNDVDESGTPSFLEGLDAIQQPVTRPDQARHYGVQDVVYPISPQKTPSFPKNPTFDDPKANDCGSRSVAVTNQFQTATISVDSNQSAPQLTPDTNGGCWSSEESLVPVAVNMNAQSPRVTVSMWNRDDDAPVQGIERSFTTGVENPRPARTPHSLAGDLAYEASRENVSEILRDGHGSWLRDTPGGHWGLAPGDRPSGEVPSPNQQAARRQRQEKNQEVFAWVSTNGPCLPPSDIDGGETENHWRPQLAEGGTIPIDEVPLGNETENRHMPGRAYLQLDGPGGRIDENDVEIMRGLHVWGDAPSIHPIQNGNQHQPPTSQAAMDKFNRQCQDNESVVSRAATWGTRRRSMPSLMDMEGVISGNFLKKLSIGHARRPSFMKRIPSLVRKPSASQLLKRKGSNASDIPPDEPGLDRRDSLAPPTRTSSWGIKKPPPSLITALGQMGTGVASVGTTHARSGSISATPITSPKSPFASLSVPPIKNTLRRPRSKTELPKSSISGVSSHPNLIDLLKKQGGPPVARLAGSQPVADVEDDEDEDDEGFDDLDMKTAANNLEAIVPTLQGFQDHILRMNPGLASSDGVSNPILVDRIAHQMLVRYKQLLAAKVKHLKIVKSRNCSCGGLCIAQGGSALPLDSRGAERGVDPMSVRPDSSDGEGAPLEGGINPESFPVGIPMPPTVTLPAEFECQLCFTHKKFQKPSDWTKHVHEDVQPFTCTWDSCRDPKMFKRKADWVRHENEGHRHLEWWTCDVEDCRHKCYRRDNFLQHLVREHKFPEPKVKTKAAIKKAGGTDPTWQKVEQCHEETLARPSDEPCRFCGKPFPSWKKLTVHLAKHMEHISLPVLKLVAAKDLDEDTVISPVQDPPPRSFGSLPMPAIKQDPQAFSPQGPSPQATQPTSLPPQMEYHHSPSTMNAYTNIPQVPLSYYTAQAVSPYTDMSQGQSSGMMMTQAYSQQAQYNTMPTTTAPYGQSNTYMNQLEPFPAFNSLGIQDPSGSLGYDNMGNPRLPSVDQYGNNTGSVSPYSHSPHQGHHGGSFYNP
ncbi:hypothetical protein F4778DRAFT_332721 [Xylariomycetidae sp. FL2044]|nr:hypothetical protein F4778DRAFT_332721 [Xylariomycetidae sp. FL2044]